MVMSCSSKRRIPKSGHEDEMRRGPWTLEEDNLLVQHIACHGEGRWNSLAKFSGLKRTGKSCRLRWLNYLKPDIKRGNLSHEEQLMILELHTKWGNRWSKIAQHLPGRTDNDIKNYWRTRVQKEARKLKIDSKSKKFLEAVRMYWTPKLIEKMEQNLSSTTSQSSSISNLETHNQNLCPDAFLSSSLKPGNQANNPDRDSISTNIPADPGSSTLHGGQSSSGKEVDDACYHVGFTGYDLKDVNLSGCHVADIDWLGEDLGSTFWDADEPGEVSLEIEL